MNWNLIRYDGDYMIVEAYAVIRDNDTGELRVYQTEELMLQEETQPRTFIWKDGNYACDCNRRLFFKRSHQEETETDSDYEYECTGGLYSVNLYNKRDNKIYYQEFVDNTIPNLMLLEDEEDTF